MICAVWRDELDGNFIDNNFEILVERANLQSDDYTVSESGKQKYDNFALRIKFNNELDPNSINSGSAVVLSGDKKVSTSVKYDKRKRSIIISPRSGYLRNKMYLLKLSGKVMSKGGRSLRENRFFVFRQSGNTLKFYKGFPGNKFENAPDQLDARVSILLPMLFAVSSAVIVISYFYSNTVGLTIGTVLVVLATAAAFIDSISDIGKSSREYVYGAKLYNNGFFSEAMECFERALHYNPGNVYAQVGLEAAIVKRSQAAEFE